jgi:PAS domain S-box-containing protein
VSTDFDGVAKQELLRAVVAGSRAALVVVDLNGVVLLWNPAAESLFGWRAAEVLRRPLQFIEFNSPAESQLLRSESAAGRDVLEVRSRRRHRDGHLVDVEVSTVGLHGSSGRVSAILGTYALPEDGGGGHRGGRG